MPPDTRYALNKGGQYVAYQAFGTGEVDLVFIPDWCTNLEIMWEEPTLARFLQRLASFSRVICFDKRGTGVSDPVPLGAIPTWAALHMYMYTLSFEAPKRGVTVTILHPGLVGTNPNLMRFPGALKTEDSVTQMMGVIEKLTPADNGRFISYKGETMPW